MSSHTLLADPVLMSRSTPGSRRNSGRGDAAELMEMVGANQARSDSLQPQVGGGRLCTPPTRASSTLSASTGRHSLDDSSCSTSAAKSLSLGRSTSLRLVANRHSVANLYHVPPGCVPNSRLAAPVLDPAMMRRKSSSALGAPHKPPDAGISYQDAQAHYRRSGSLHASSQHYCRLDADSRQYLLAQNEPAAELSEQDSELSSDDDVDCLLAHSDYTLDSADSKPFAEQKGVEVRVETASASDPPLASLHQLTVLDSNRLAIADADSRYSGTTTPVTPSHEGEGEEEGGTLAVPAWVSSERRGSFLRRLVPAAAESVMNMMGQSAPRGDPAEAGKQAVVVGEIKLGFIMTKGFLEIEVIGARDLPDSVNGPFPPGEWRRETPPSDPLSRRHLREDLPLRPRPAAVQAEDARGGGRAEPTVPPDPQVRRQHHLRPHSARVGLGEAEKDLRLEQPGGGHRDQREPAGTAQTHHPVVQTAPSGVAQGHSPLTARARPGPPWCYWPHTAPVKPVIGQHTPLNPHYARTLPPLALLDPLFLYLSSHRQSNATSWKAARTTDCTLWDRLSCFGCPV